MTDSDRLSEEFSAAQISLLMAEYDHLAESFLSNEAMGERRINVFFGLIGAVTAVIGLMADNFQTSVDLSRAVLVASLLLFAVGCATLRRLMERNLATTEFLNGLDRIRAFFAQGRPEFIEVLPFVPVPKHRRRVKKPWWGIGRAGYLEVTAIANCLLVGGGLVVWLWHVIEPAWAVALATIAALLIWLAQMGWVQVTYRRESTQRESARAKALEAWSTKGSTDSEG